MFGNKDITGRDGYIIQQALYVAAKTIRNQRYPELSNADDMEAIAEALFPGSFKRWAEIDMKSQLLRIGQEIAELGFNLTGAEKFIAAGIDFHNETKAELEQGRGK